MIPSHWKPNRWKSILLRRKQSSPRASCEMHCFSFKTNGLTNGLTIHPDLDQRKNENNSNRLHLPELRMEDCARERSGTHSFGCELFLACWPHITTVKRRGQWTFYFSITSSRNPLGQVTSAFKYRTYCILKLLWNWHIGSYWVIVRRLVKFTSPWSILSRHCPHSDANWLPSSLSIPGWWSSL
jgi:hypothetical protein